jgi:hypothetical protein
VALKKPIIVGFPLGALIQCMPGGFTARVHAHRWVLAQERAAGTNDDVGQRRS